MDRDSSAQKIAATTAAVMLRKEGRGSRMLTGSVVGPGGFQEEATRVLRATGFWSSRVLGLLDVWV